MFELLEVLQHIVHEIDADPNASDSEVMDAIDWERVRRVLNRQILIHKLSGGTLTEDEYDSPAFYDPE